jgi:hypothetical protein
MITNSSLSFGSLVSTVAVRRRGCTGIHGVSLSGGEEEVGGAEGLKDSHGSERCSEFASRVWNPLTRRQRSHHCSRWLRRR